MSTQELTLATYKSGLKPIWCAGCGDYGAINPFYQALLACEIQPRNTVIVSGIGCSGRFPYFCNTYGFHGVHGRALPTAAGMKLARPDLDIFAVGGDGDGLGIGGGHLPHVARKNLDITYLLLDNSIYGLTKGQSSPTSPLDMKSKTAPYGFLEEPLNPLAMYVGYNVSFIARGFSGKPKQLKELLIQAIRHRGFSIVHVLSPCVSMNRQVTFESMKQLYAELPEDHDPTSRVGALERALDTSRLWTGLFYREERTTIHDRVEELEERAGGPYKDLGELLAHYK